MRRSSKQGQLTCKIDDREDQTCGAKEEGELENWEMVTLYTFHLDDRAQNTDAEEGRCHETDKCDEPSHTAERSKLSDLAAEGQRLQTRRDGQVRWSALLGHDART